MIELLIGMVIGPLVLAIAWLSVGLFRWGFASWRFQWRFDVTAKRPVIGCRLLPPGDDGNDREPDDREGSDSTDEHLMGAH